jgi:hypothetical protein
VVRSLGIVAARPLPKLTVLLGALGYRPRRCSDRVLMEGERYASQADYVVFPRPTVRDAGVASMGRGQCGDSRDLANNKLFGF